MVIRGADRNLVLAHVLLPDRQDLRDGVPLGAGLATLAIAHTGRRAVPMVLDHDHLGHRRPPLPLNAPAERLGAARTPHIHELYELIELAQLRLRLRLRLLVHLVYADVEATVVGLGLRVRGAHVQVGALLHEAVLVYDPDLVVAAVLVVDVEDEEDAPVVVVPDHVLLAVLVLGDENAVVVPVGVYKH